MAFGEESTESGMASIDTVSSLEAIPLHSTNLLTLLDEQGIVHYESPAIERLYGYDQTDLVGEFVGEYFHPEDREEVMAAFQRVVERATTGDAADDSLSDDGVEAVEYRHLMADGSYRWIESVASPNPTSEGYYVVNSRDISAQKARERELERAREQAQTERDGKEAIQQLLLATGSSTEIAAGVCQLLVTEYEYPAAWVTYGTVPETAEMLAFSGDDQDFRACWADVVDGPTRWALETGDTVEVVRGDDSERIDGDDNRAATIDALSACGLSAVRAVPIVYDGVSSGVLTVVETDPETTPRLDGERRAMLAELAQAIGFKRQLQHQHKTLASGTVLELDIRISEGYVLSGVCGSSGDASVPPEAQVEAYERLEDGETTFLLTSETVSGAELHAAAEAVDGLTSVQQFGEEGAAVSAVAAGPTVGTVVDSHGGIVESTTVEDGVVDVTVRFAQLIERDAVVDALNSHWPTATIRAREERPLETQYVSTVAGLTRRQEEALRVATVAGFFDRPQQATASDVADLLDVSRSTFLYHLRQAEAHIFQTLF